LLSFAHDPDKIDASMCGEYLQTHDPCGRTTTTTILRPFIRDYPGEPVPEETFTHSPILIII